MSFLHRITSALGRFYQSCRFVYGWSRALASI